MDKETKGTTKTPVEEAAKEAPPASGGGEKPVTNAQPGRVRTLDTILSLKELAGQTPGRTGKRH